VYVSLSRLRRLPTALAIVDLPARAAFQDPGHPTQILTLNATGFEKVRRTVRSVKDFTSPLPSDAAHCTRRLSRQNKSLPLNPRFPLGA